MLLSDESNNWTFTFYNLDKYFNGSAIVYRINETEVVNYTTVIVNDGYNWNVTNTHIIGLINITVIKVWGDNDNQDGFRPDDITVYLYGDGNPVNSTVLSEDNGWNCTFYDLPARLNGKLIRYTVNESEVVNYTVLITGDNGNFIINNTHITELVNVTVKKIWIEKNNNSTFQTC